jgi:hypothetical protein
MAACSIDAACGHGAPVGLPCMVASSATAIKRPRRGFQAESQLTVFRLVLLFVVDAIHVSKYLAGGSLLCACRLGIFEVGRP